MKETNLFIITASQKYINQAFLELCDIDKGLKMAKFFGNGVMLIQPKMEKEELNHAIKEGRVIFVRHINPVDYILDVEKNTEPKEIAEAIKVYSTELSHSERVSVQIRIIGGEFDYTPFEYKSAIDEMLNYEFSLEPEIKNPNKIISILFNENKCYIGLSEASNNLSPWNGGMIHYSKKDTDISRSKFKLMEAIFVFDIDMKNIKRALDLGAAPGGWTSVLLEQGVFVTSVDTGEMDSRLNKYKNYEFINTNASLLQLPDESYDMLTSDISWNPINTANMVKKASSYLKKGGLAVVTVKLMGNKVTKQIKEVSNVYKEVFDIEGARQLFHNRDEITLYMKKR